MVNPYIVVLVVVAIVIYTVYFYKKEKLENIPATRTVNTVAKCSKCKIWNSRDARSKCDALCKEKYPAKDIRYTGIWSSEGAGASCECSFEGGYKKHFVGCPTASSLGKSDCFVWNNSEAKASCPGMCTRFLPGKGSKWTGEWKNTSANTTACECEYHD